MAASRPCASENSLKLRLHLILCLKPHLISSSCCSISILCMTKVVSFCLDQFDFDQKRQNRHVTVFLNQIRGPKNVLFQTSYY